MVVILDEDEDTKSATSPRPSQSNSRNRQLEDIEAAPPYDSEQTPLRYPYDVPPSRPLFKRGEPAGPRFWKAFFVAWAVWFLVAFSVILEIEISIDLNKDRWVIFFIDCVINFNANVQDRLKNQRIHPLLTDLHTRILSNQKNLLPVIPGTSQR